MSALNRRSKWTKYRFMSRFEELKQHVPKTRLLKPKHLWKLVAQFGDVILKPANGSRGAGVFRVTALGKDTYIVHWEKLRTYLRGKEGVYDYLKEKIGSRSYIVQRRIPLATVNGRPFDMRVIVQRKRGTDSWKVTGKVVKVAGEGYIVTNIARSGGTVLPLETAIRRSSLKSLSRRNLLDNIKKVALLSAEKLSNSELYASQRIFGFDMGLDQNGRVWIIEANLKPMLSHFRKLRNKSMYYRIMEYKKG